MDLTEFRTKILGEGKEASEGSLGRCILLHHSGKSHEIPVIELCKALCKQAGFSGNIRDSIVWSTNALYGVEGKVSRKTLLYLETEEKYKKALTVKQLENFGFKIQISENLIDSDKDETFKVSKRITCGRVPPFVVLPLIESLKKYATFNEGDVLVSPNGNISMPVSEYHKPLPKFIGMWRGLKEIRVSVNATGYSHADVAKFRSLKETGTSGPSLMRSTSTSDPSTDPNTFWSGNCITKKPDKVQTCHFCKEPGHIKVNCNQRKEYLAKLQCFRCFEMGHNKYTCPNEERCRACHQEGHKQYQPECKGRNYGAKMRRDYRRSRAATTSDDAVPSDLTAVGAKAITSTTVDTGSTGVALESEPVVVDLTTEELTNHLAGSEVTESTDAASGDAELVTVIAAVSSAPMPVHVTGTVASVDNITSDLEDDLPPVSEATGGSVLDTSDASISGIVLNILKSTGGFSTDSSVTNTSTATVQVDDDNLQLLGSLVDSIDLKLPFAAVDHRSTIIGTGVEAIEEKSVSGNKRQATWETSPTAEKPPNTRPKIANNRTRSNSNSGSVNSSKESKRKNGTKAQVTRASGPKKQPSGKPTGPLV